MWSEKHRPKNISDMVGNEESRSAIVEWFTKWKKGTKSVFRVRDHKFNADDVINPY